MLFLKVFIKVKRAYCSPSKKKGIKAKKKRYVCVYLRGAWERRVPPKWIVSSRTKLAGAASLQYRTNQKKWDTKRKKKLTTLPQAAMVDTIAEELPVSQPYFCHKGQMRPCGRKQRLHTQQKMKTHTHTHTHARLANFHEKKKRDVFMRQQGAIK